jgi:hypothetical protein
MDLARCKLELLRVRSFRQDLLLALLEHPLPPNLRLLKNLERYERATLAQQKPALRAHTMEGG